VPAFEKRVVDDNDETEGRQTGNDMSLNEIMDLWQQKAGDLSEDLHQPGELGLDEHDNNGLPDNDDDPLEQELPRLDEYRSLIQGAPTYSWLLSNIENECTLFTPGHNSVKDVRNGILEELPISQKISRRTAIESHSASFKINWDPGKFLLEEGYQETPQEAIERVLTFTGAGTEVQAENFGRYMRRTWPSTGEAMILLLKSLVSDYGKRPGREPPLSS